MRGANDVIEAWEHIYGNSENGFDDGSPKYVCLFSGLRSPKRDWEPGEVNKERLKAIHEEYFQWPEEMEQAEKWLQKESQKGREVYHCAHLLTERKRKKENAAYVKTLFADGDGAVVSDSLPAPTLTVESSPNRDQYYWRLKSAISPEKAEELNQRLAYAMGADKSGWDLTQLLRPPGTSNHKYEGKPSVETKEILDKAYDPNELDKILPTLPREQKARKKESKYLQDDSQSSTSEIKEPPIVLDEYGMEVWVGSQIKLAEDGSVDRSASLLKFGGVLYDAGATRKPIIDALRERDESLGWCKYLKRKTDDEYHRIVDKLECRERKNYSYAEKKAYPHQQKKTSCIEFVSWGEIAEKGFEPPEELIEDVILAGKRHHIFSGAGNGKTFLALYFTKKVIEQDKTVLYFDKENGKRIICERLIGSLGADPKQVDEYLLYSPFPDLSTQDGLNEYLSVLDQKKPDLVIFDSWINFLSDSGLDENVSTDIAEWSVDFVHPVHERNIAVILLDHVPKEGNGSARGSGRKKEEADVQWELRSKNFDRNRVGEIELKLRKDREGWLPNSVKFSVGGTDDGFVFRRIGGASKEAGNTDSELTDNARKILKVLQEHFEEGATATEWEQASLEIEEVSHAVFYRSKKTLIEGEHFSKKGKKFYPQSPQVRKSAA